DQYPSQAIADSFSKALYRVILCTEDPKTRKEYMLEQKNLMEHYPGMDNAVDYANSLIGSAVNPEDLKEQEYCLSELKLLIQRYPIRHEAAKWVLLSVSDSEYHPQDQEEINRISKVMQILNESPSGNPMEMGVLKVLSENIESRLQQFQTN
ncbi:MAG: hypothetical protein HUJ54_12850, partial [Erysipelotrichaceae bacterium]|nr:hypothetical protein [Erysipelotrichaceae bacterium]